ncbi:MAG: helix-turn-helix domain-containing protein [Polyangia bacterium]|jgi:AcrR family transcriptional regulator|nr:helix-turn-helix domain-containing protein [Polyangia bacterium]
MRRLEKARQDPDGTMAKTLAVARRVFGDYGFHGTTTRMIAREAGVDVATLYYHWGEKQELYEAVVTDITEDLRKQLRSVEQEIHGRPLGERMARSIDAMTDYLFLHPEVANLVLLRYFAKTRSEPVSDLRVPSFVQDIALSMRLAEPGAPVPPEARMRVLAIMNAIYNFVSGREFFQPMVEVEPGAYVELVKSTLKFLFIPAFTSAGTSNDPREEPRAGQAADPAGSE